MKASSHLTLSFVFLVLVAAGYWYAYFSVSRESIKAAEISVSIASLTQTAERTEAVNQALVELGGSEEVVENHFVSDDNIVGFLEEMQKLATSLEAGMDVLSVAAGKDAARPTLTVSLRIQGSFSAVMRTLGALEYAPYALTVSSLNMSENADEKMPWSAGVTLTIGSKP